MKARLNKSFLYEMIAFNSRERFTNLVGGAWEGPVILSLQKWKLQYILVDENFGFIFKTGAVYSEY